MKKLLTLTALSLCMLGFAGCSRGTGNQVPITDAPTLESMNTLTKDGVNYYFDLTIPQDMTFDYEAFESHLPSPDDKDVLMHYNNVFQAMLKDDPIEGKVAGYGGVLNPDTQEIMGLIVNIYDEKTEPQAFTEEQLIDIASNFLNSKKLVGSDETLTFTNINKDASSKVVQILNFDSETTRYAVGINMQHGKVVYFEHVPLSLFQ